MGAHQAPGIAAPQLPREVGNAPAHMKKGSPGLRGCPEPSTHWAAHRCILALPWPGSPDDFCPRSWFRCGTPRRRARAGWGWVCRRARESTAPGGAWELLPTLQRGAVRLQVKQDGLIQSCLPGRPASRLSRPVGGAPPSGCWRTFLGEEEHGPKEPRGTRRQREPPQGPHASGRSRMEGTLSVP